jgi:hypothetical protein
MGMGDLIAETRLIAGHVTDERHGHHLTTKIISNKVRV